MLAEMTGGEPKRRRRTEDRPTRRTSKLASPQSELAKMADIGGEDERDEGGPWALGSSQHTHPTEGRKNGIRERKELKKKSFPPNLILPAGARNPAPHAHTPTSHARAHGTIAHAERSEPIRRGTNRGY